MYTSKLFLILIAGGAIYPMCLKRFAMVCLFACLVLGRLASAADMNRSEACHLAKAAQAVLETKLPGWTIVSKSDLPEHDRALWNAKHLDQCPGVAAGDYFGRGNPSYAVTLINRQPTKMLQTLVVLKPHDGSYEVIEVSEPQVASRVLLIFKLKPGVFEDIKNGEKVRSHSDAIAYEDIAAGMLVYTWHRGRFRAIQVSE